MIKGFAEVWCQNICVCFKVFITKAIRSWALCAGSERIVFRIAGGDNGALRAANWSGMRVGSRNGPRNWEIRV